MYLGGSMGGEILSARSNVFQGVEIDPDGLPQDPEVFERVLSASLEAWRVEGHQVVWLEIPVDRASLIPIAVAGGFRFHHCQESSVTLTLRLRAGAFVPLYATHCIGAGGLVLNEARELLVVLERAHCHRRPRYYKLPGGALKPGERLVDGVIREVWEETGIRTDFLGLVGFRHWHGYRFGKSDIYFICRLRPLTFEIRIQESEIDACQWMPLEDFLAAEIVGAFNKHMVAAALRGGGLVPTWFEDYAVSPATHEIFVPGGPRED